MVGVVRVNSFEPNNPIEQKLGYSTIRVLESENDLEEKSWTSNLAEQNKNGNVGQKFRDRQAKTELSTEPLCPALPDHVSCRYHD